MIEVSSVTKHYKEKKAVDDLTFDIKPGQVTGFLGPNGSGKSTTMRLIMGLDEPINGLDPEGILWVRTLLKGLASEGRTVFVSSHLMSEMALTADHLVVIGRGRLISTGSVDDFIAKSSGQFIRVRTPRVEDLNTLILQHGGHVIQESDGALAVTDLSAFAIGELAGRSGIFLHELSPQAASLEEAFMELTRDSVEYHAHLTTATSANTSSPESGNQ